MDDKETIRQLREEIAALHIELDDVYRDKGKLIEEVEMLKGEVDATDSLARVAIQAKEEEIETLQQENKTLKGEVEALTEMYQDLFRSHQKILGIIPHDYCGGERELRKIGDVLEESLNQPTTPGEGELGEDCVHEFDLASGECRECGLIHPDYKPPKEDPQLPGDVIEGKGATLLMHPEKAKELQELLEEPCPDCGGSGEVKDTIGSCGTGFIPCPNPNCKREGGDDA